MKLKHTSSPWKPIFNGNYWDIKCRIDDDDDISLYSPYIASCVDNAYYEHTKQHSEANARLIAAAPDLLNELIKIYNTMYMTQHECYWMPIKNIIEKATGSTIEEVLNEMSKV